MYTHMYLSLSIYIYMYICVHTYTYTCACTHIYIYIYIYRCTHTYAHIYIYIYIYTHTYIRTNALKHDCGKQVKRCTCNSMHLCVYTSAAHSVSWQNMPRSFEAKFLGAPSLKGSTLAHPSPAVKPRPRRELS